MAKYVIDPEVALRLTVENAALPAGRLRKATDPNGVEVIYEYDPFGRLWAEYDSEAALGEQDERWDGSARKWYKLWDNPWMAGDSLNLDPANDDPFVILDRTWPYTYNKDAVGYEYKTLTYYDGFGRPIQQQDMMAEVDGQTGRRDIIVSTEYGAQGKATCVSVPRDIATYKERINWLSVTTFLDDDCESLDATLTSYDNIGRTTTITNPGGSVSSLYHDIVNDTNVNGVWSLNRVQSVDPDGHSLYRYYDLDGQLVKVREFTGTVASGLCAYADTEYTYDWQGNLTQVENREPHQSGGGDLLSTTVITYDVLGRKTGMDDADMGIWDYEYDAIGNLVRQKDANGDAICTWYDSLGRPIRGKPFCHEAPARGGYFSQLRS